MPTKNPKFDPPCSTNDLAGWLSSVMSKNGREITVVIKFEHSQANLDHLLSLRASPEIIADKIGDSMVTIRLVEPGSVVLVREGDGA